MARDHCMYLDVFRADAGVSPIRPIARNASSATSLLKQPRLFIMTITIASIVAQPCVWYVMEGVYLDHGAVPLICHFSGVQIALSSAQWQQRHARNPLSLRGDDGGGVPRLRRPLIWALTVGTGTGARN